MKDWDALYEECIHCQKCGLAETRTNVVFGEGARDAEVMFIGEGPGEQEDRTGRPFVGRAGQLLDDMLAMIDLKREKVFIGNMVKCRPPQNRDPLNIEQEACIGYLRNQVALLKPKIIVCLGRIAAMKLIKEDFKITREHGQWLEKAGNRYRRQHSPQGFSRLFVPFGLLRPLCASYRLQHALVLDTPVLPQAAYSRNQKYLNYKLQPKQEYKRWLSVESLLPLKESEDCAA